MKRKFVLSFEDVKTLMAVTGQFQKYRFLKPGSSCNNHLTDLLRTQLGLVGEKMYKILIQKEVGKYYEIILSKIEVLAILSIEMDFVSENYSNSLKQLKRGLLEKYY